MLELCKEVLSKVSFDKALFAKELRKSTKWLKGHDRASLKEWCLKRYGEIYGDLILSTFSNPALV
jgi:hypothetical protein|tara:strand:- start:2425 stop:2619 length:195 start_codon:yes stop_codon:yes gene_type:complete